jgi:hypothetical protein
MFLLVVGLILFASLLPLLPGATTSPLAHGVSDVRAQSPSSDKSVPTPQSGARSRASLAEETDDDTADHVGSRLETAGETASRPPAPPSSPHESERLPSSRVYALCSIRR